MNQIWFGIDWSHTQIHSGHWIKQDSLPHNPRMPWIPYNEEKFFDTSFCSSGVNCSMWYISGANLYSVLERMISSRKVWNSEFLLGFLWSHHQHPLQKSLEIQEICKYVLIGIKDLEVYNLLLFPFKLNGNVTNAQVRNRDFKRNWWLGNRIHFIKVERSPRLHSQSMKVC